MKPNISRQRRHTLGSLAVAVLLGPAAGLGVSAQAYQLVDLGVDVSPTDIDNAGTVVGSRSTAQGAKVAFRYVPGQGLEDITIGTVANAVNGSGQIAGNTPTGAFLMDGARTQEWDDHAAYGLNATGQVAGSRAKPNPYRATPQPLDPALYRDGAWQVLDVARVYSRGTRKGVYADLFAMLDVNDAGFAVGRKSRSGLAGSSAILTTPAFKEVTYLPIPYGGYAAAINNLNHVVGTTGNDSASGSYAHAFLYDYDAGTLTDLGTLNGGLRSSAADINDADQVVGSAWLATVDTSLYDPAQYHAFLWDAAGGMQDLNALVSVSGWTLTAATAINDNGDIVGTGLYGGQAHGFLLTSAAGSTPPPASVAPVAVAGADVTRGRAPLTVNFTAQGSYDPDGTIAAWAWDFGDGASSTAENPSHTYTQPGRYLARLTVTDDQGLTATAQLEIRVRKAKGGRR